MTAARSLATLAVAVVMTLLLAGCTSAPPAGTSAPGGATPAAQPGATDGGAATQQPGGPQADVSDPCGLATVDEVAQSLGIGDPLDAEADTTGTTTYCNYRTPDGTSVMALSFSRGQTFVFDSFKNSEDAIPVPGIGDDAVFASGTLFIKRGDAVVGIQAGQVDLEDTDAIIAALSIIAQAIAGRLQ